MAQPWQNCQRIFFFFLVKKSIAKLLLSQPTTHFLAEEFLDKIYWLRCRSLLNCVPCVPTFLCANMVYVPRCLRASMVYVPTCQRCAHFSFFRANVSINVPTCHMACHCFNLWCQRAKWCTNFSTRPANVPKGVSIFQTFLWRNAKGNFYTLLLYKKFYILLDIIVIQICICIISKNCINNLFLYFISYRRKVCGVFLFRYFFLYCALVRY